MKKSINRLFLLIAVVLLGLVVAACEREQFTVSFDSNGGSNVDPILVLYDEPIEAPVEPTKEGYTFVGWFIEESLTTVYDFNFLVRESFTLYAKWKINSYEFVFYTNGGTLFDEKDEPLTQIIVEYQGSVEAPVNDPVRDGYEFEGWYTDSAYTTPFDFETFKMPAKNTTIFAKWSASTCKVTYTSDDEVFKELDIELGKPVGQMNEVPIKVGFTFAGWYYTNAKGEEKEFTSSYVVNESVTAYAKWTVNQYTVSFEENGGSEVADITIDYYSDITRPTNPTKVGYKFEGWYKDAEFKEAYSFENAKMPAENIKLYAKWSVNEYTISFEENGGTNVDNITVAYNSSVSAPVAPTKDGYTFAGWYSDEALTTAYTFTTMPLDGLKLYAKWNINKYTIAFEENGGSEVANIVADYQTSVTRPENPTKVGHVFVGWYSDESLTQNYEFTTMPLEGITVYAKWSVNQYTITFVTNEGSEVANITDDYGSMITKPADPTRLGYTFGGWFEKANLSGNAYEFSTIPLNGVILYAKWVINSYTLTIKFKNDITDDVLETVVYNSSLAAYKPENPTKSGTQFKGWVTVNGTFEFENAIMPASDLVVEAVYEDEVTINFGGYATLIGLKGESLTIPADPTKDGYTFAGWYLDENCETEFDLTVFPETDLSVYAKWAINKYTITFVENDGTDVDDITQEYQSPVTKPADPTKDGYTFGGWYIDEKGTQTYVFTTMPLDGITLYAKWNINSYSIKFETNGGDAVADITAEYNSSVSAPKAPVISGYTFVGWYEKADLSGSEYVFDKMPLNGTTLYAKWTPNTYTIIFNINGGTGSVANINATYDVEYTFPSTGFTRDGYTLIGWSLSSTGNDVDYTLDAKHSNLATSGEKTVYAVWEINKYEVTFDIDGKTQTVTVEHGTVLGNVDDLPTATKLGYTLSWKVNNNTVALSDVTVTSGMTVKAEYEVNKYDVQFISDGKVIYTVTMPYGSAVTFDSYVAKLKSDLLLLAGDKTLTQPILGFNDIVLAVISTGGANADYNAALGAYFTNEELYNSLISVNSIVKAAVESYLAGSLAIDGLYSIMEGQASDISKLIPGYEFNKLSTGYAPFKQGYIFNGWILGDDTKYIDSEGNEYITGGKFIGKTPASTTASTTVKLVATYKKLEAINYFEVLTNDGVTSINWEAADASFVDTKTHTYKLYYNVYYLNGEKLVLLGTSNTNSYTFTEYGTYSIMIYSYIEVYNKSNGALISTFESEKPEKAIDVTVAIEGLGDTFDESKNGDYYRRGTVDGKDAFIFYTENKYTFSGANFNFQITDLNGGEANSTVVTAAGNVLQTNKSTGTFYFINGIDKYTEGELAGQYKVYYAVVVPYVTQYTLDKDLSNFKDSQSSQSTFLDGANAVYTIGRYDANDVADSNPNKDTNANIYNNVLAYKNNGFKFGLNIATFGGADINYVSYGDYITYKFYDENFNTEINSSNIGVYDRATGSWSFTAAAGKYGVEMSISNAYLAPKQVRDELFPTIRFVFELDNSINVFTHEQFKEVYANMTLGSTNVNADGYIVRGISLHSDITAQISKEQTYYQGNTNPAMNTYSNRYNYRNPVDGSIYDGSPINIYLTNILNAYNSDYKDGNVYMRASKTNVKEKYNINGNCFTIHGQKLPYASINSRQNLSSVSGYEIADTQVSVLTYIVGGNNIYGVNNTNEAGQGHLYVNDLQIISNTSKPTFDASSSDSSLQVMNRNSGGYIGITAANGNSLTLTNSIISNATLGVRSDYGMDGAGNHTGQVTTIDHTKILSCWSNSVYGYYAGDFVIKDSYIKDSGGAAINFEDGTSPANPSEGYRQAILSIDNNTIIENYVAGTEGYFKAYSMELVAMQVKAAMDGNIKNVVDNLNQPALNDPEELAPMIMATNPSLSYDQAKAYATSITSTITKVPDFTVIKSITDSTTGQETEKFNFIMLFATTDKNSENLDQTYANAAMIRVYLDYDNYANNHPILGMLGYSSQFPGYYDVGYLSSAYNTPVGVTLPYALSGLAVNPDYNGQGSEGIFMFANPIPGRGNCFVGVGINRK